MLSQFKNQNIFILILFLWTQLNIEVVRSSIDIIVSKDDLKTLFPVVFVPGDGGSQIEGRLNKTKVVHYICYKKSDWFVMWLNLEQLVPEVVDCWVDNMKLIYNNVTRKTENNEGVEVRVPGFGNSSTVEWLDPSRTRWSVYFYKIANQLTLQGYVRGKNMHGAPYDFRKAANEHGEYFKDVKVLIESSYKNNSNTPVILVCHSMGSTMMLYFLNQQTQKWKDTYIRSLVTIAGPWGGTVRALKVFAIGDNLGAYILSQTKIMSEQRSSPSLLWLMPSDKFWGKDEVLVQTPEKNYTLDNLKSYFMDMSTPSGYDMYLDTRNLIRDMTPPGVEVHCMHGVGVKTTTKLVYSKGGFPSSIPTLEKGDGDGTVNIRSLRGCLKWKTGQKQKVEHHEFQGKNHLEVLRDDNVAEDIANVILKINNS